MRWMRLHAANFTVGGTCAGSCFRLLPLLAQVRYIQRALGVSRAACRDLGHDDGYPESPSVT